jgi:peptidyl-prolyl cis-trans isomerase B (cyclophilin B)
MHNSACIKNGLIFRCYNSLSKPIVLIRDQIIGEQILSKFKLAGVTALLLMLAACNGESTPASSSSDATTPTNSTINTEENPMVTLKTNLGDIELELDTEKAPVSVANFLSYANDGHYNGTIFHRVIPGFMIQGGGFEPGMTQKGTKAQITNEANNGLKNDTFTIAMARTPDPHSATSQFFINVNDNASLNFSSETSQGWGYAVFGKVTNGEDIVRNIEAVATGRSGPHGDVPAEDVVIESVVVGE